MCACLGGYRRTPRRIRFRLFFRFIDCLEQVGRGIRGLKPLRKIHINELSVNSEGNCRHARCIDDLNACRGRARLCEPCESSARTMITADRRTTKAARIKSSALETPLKGHDRPNAAARLILKKDSRLDGGVPRGFPRGSRASPTAMTDTCGMDSEVLDQFAKGFFAHAIHCRKIRRPTTGGNRKCRSVVRPVEKLLTTLCRSERAL